jgi:mono/diheme cytochrome c family protein
MRNVYLVTAFLVVLAISILGFRGSTFTHPPMDVFPEWAFPGMKYQVKYKPQGPSVFFADGPADRMPPPGVVPTGYGPAGQPLRSDDHLYLGKNPDGSFARGFPASITVDRALLERGRDRYTIYCSPCHGSVGDGNGITKRYGMGATPTYHDDRLRKMAEGEIFNTITNGKAPVFNMSPYADKLSPQDRWAVIAYIRALQRAQMGTAADVPAEHKAELGLK